LAEKAVDQLAERLGHDAPRWTGTTALPGGDMPAGIEAFGAEMAARYPFLSDALRQRLIHAYGTRITKVLGEAKTLKSLGRHYGGGLYQAELDYLISQEWATSAEDVLWRRTKLGLFLGDKQRRALSDHFDA
jgi:glycerol-3-phosphate dehydrogenase